LRKTVLPGLFAFACLPFVMHYLEHSPAKTCGISLLAALVLLAHRRNLMDEFLHLLEPRQMKPNTTVPNYEHTSPSCFQNCL